MTNKPLPPLGRPLSGASVRDKYLKIYLSKEELSEFEKLEIELKKLYSSKGYFYNRPNHLRLFIHNLLNPHVLHFLFENPTNELEKAKKD